MASTVLRTMTVAVPETVAAELDSAVARGDFADRDSAVAAALQVWSFDMGDAEVLAHLKAQWAEGIASGPGGEATTVLDRLDTRYLGTRIG